jgi:hypothetical protein
MSAEASASKIGSGGIGQVAGVNPRTPRDVDATARRRLNALAGFFL